MKINTTILLAWLWGILGDAIEGFAHGAVIGTGFDTLSPNAPIPILHAALLGGLLGAGKQALLYLNTNRIPALLVASDEPAKPSPGVVSSLLFMGLLGLACLGLAGCGTLAPQGAYNGDKILYVADQTEVAAYSAVHAFVSFEYDNRAALAAHSEIKATADHVRMIAPKLFVDYDTARGLYLAVHSADSQAGLAAAIAPLQTLVTQSASFLLSSQILVKK